MYMLYRFDVSNFKHAKHETQLQDPFQSIFKFPRMLHKYNNEFEVFFVLFKNNQYASSSWNEKVNFTSVWCNLKHDSSTLKYAVCITFHFRE